MSKLFHNKIFIAFIIMVIVFIGCSVCSVAITGASYATKAGHPDSLPARDGELFWEILSHGFIAAVSY